MNDHSPTLTERFSDAVEFARRTHEGDVRKGTSVPYLSHLMSVSALVLEHGGSEDQAIAGLLHDTAEDHGGQRKLDEIRGRFGDTVADIVAVCTDSLADRREDKEPWWPRKVKYVDHLASAPEEALLVSAADKLHNARCILADLRRDGTAVWGLFNKDAGRVGTLWYYRRLAGVFAEHLAGSTLAAELQRTVGSILDRAAALGGDVEEDWSGGCLKEQEVRSDLLSPPAPSTGP